jgi:hypothetical protein
MKRLTRSIVLLFVAGVAAQSAWCVSPCDGVDRNLTANHKLAFAPAIARQLRVQRVDVLQSFRFGGWIILYVNSHDADEAFLFYPHDPLHTRYVTMWSGAAAWNEEESIRAWTVKNAPGIPPRLASCFAWHVTSDRDQ